MYEAFAGAFPLEGPVAPAGPIPPARETLVAAGITVVTGAFGRPRSADAGFLITTVLLVVLTEVTEKYPALAMAKKILSEYEMGMKDTSSSVMVTVFPDAGTTKDAVVVV